MNHLIYEQVNDVDATYPYLCIYREKNDLNPFMEISITDTKELQFLFYESRQSISLNFEDWVSIQSKSTEFLEMILANEEQQEHHPPSH